MLEFYKYLIFVPIFPLSDKELLKTYRHEFDVQIPTEYLYAGQDFLFEDTILEYISDDYVFGIEVSVHNKHLVVYDGHHRLIAAHILEQEWLNCKIVTDDSELNFDYSTYLKPKIKQTKLLKYRKYVQSQTSF